VKWFILVSSYLVNLLPSRFLRPTRDVGLSTLLRQYTKNSCKTLASLVWKVLNLIDKSTSPWDYSFTGGKAGMWNVLKAIGRDWNSYRRPA